MPVHPGALQLATEISRHFTVDSLDYAIMEQSQSILEQLRMQLNELNGFVNVFGPDERRSQIDISCPASFKVVKDALTLFLSDHVPDLHVELYRPQSNTKWSALYSQGKSLEEFIHVEAPEMRFDCAFNSCRYLQLDSGEDKSLLAMCMLINFHGCNVKPEVQRECYTILFKLQA